MAACIFFPSLGEVQKYLGGVAVAAYIAVVVGVVYSADRWLTPFLSRRLTQRAAIALAAAAIIFAAAVVLYLHPIAEAGVVRGGSDSDDALNIAVREIVEGRYPYYERTYLGNPILPAPGAVLLAAPFVLLGDVACQNIFGLCVLFLIFCRVQGDSRPALVLLCALMLLSPALMQQMVSGSDKLANAIYVLLGVLLVAHYLTREGLGWVARFAPCLFLGVALSSRANYLLLAPPLYSYLVKRLGFRKASAAAGVSIAAFLGVTAPFYLYDPAGYSPLLAYSKITGLDAVIPHASTALLGVSIAISVWLAFSATDGSAGRLMRNIALTQLVPTLGVVIFACIVMGAQGLAAANYGFSFALAGIVAAVLTRADL